MATVKPHVMAIPLDSAFEREAVIAANMPSPPMGFSIENKVAIKLSKKASEIMTELVYHFLSTLVAGKFALFGYGNNTNFYGINFKFDWSFFLNSLF